MAKAAPLRKAGRKAGAKSERAAKAERPASSPKRVTAKGRAQAGESSHKPGPVRLARGKVSAQAGRPAIDPVVIPETPPPLPAPIASFTF
jgi:hypothetical protein